MPLIVVVSLLKLLVVNIRKARKGPRGPRRDVRAVTRKGLPLTRLLALSGRFLSRRSSHLVSPPPPRVGISWRSLKISIQNSKRIYGRC